MFLNAISLTHLCHTCVDLWLHSNCRVLLWLKQTRITVTALEIRVPWQ